MTFSKKLNFISHKRVKKSAKLNTNDFMMYSSKLIIEYFWN